MSGNMIKLYTATTDEQLACQDWEIWESGNATEFNYDYDQDVEFVVQQGEAVICSQNGEKIAISAGKRVIIGAGVSACWDISSPIKNRYRYTQVV